MSKRETNASRKADENFKQYCALKARTETTTRLADILMKQYIKELVGSYTDTDAVLSEVRPDMEVVDDDLRRQLDRVLAENPATETRIKQRISNLYDDETGPQSLTDPALRTPRSTPIEQWKEQLYERTLYEICEETFTAH